MTSLDKPWYSPALKLMNKDKQNKFYKNGNTPRYKQLKTKFRNAKRKASKTFYGKFVTDLQMSKPGQYHKMAKKIGAVDKNSQGDLFIECLEGLDPAEQVEKVAQSFAAVSCEYEAVKLELLPAYLPAEEPPQLQVYFVYQKIQNQKRTKSTLPIDIPDILRKEAAEFLAEPLTDIYNTCLTKGTYPRAWKKEFVTPVPKGKPNQILKALKDVRKIASTSDFSKIK